MRRFALLVGLTSVFAGLAAAPALALDVLGPPTLNTGGPFVRNVPKQVTVGIPTEEPSLLDEMGNPELNTLSFGSPQAPITAAGNCTTDIGAICIPIAAGGGVVYVILPNLNADLGEPLQLTGTPTMAPPNIALDSVEGSPVYSGFTLLFISAAPIGLGAGTPVNNAVPAPVVGNPGTDAQIALATTSPGGGASAQQGSTIDYSATLTRTGVASGTTNVGVSLTPSGGNAHGTSVSGPSTQQISFGPGETVKNVSFTVDVPAGAIAGESPAYFFRATFDPSGTDGTPIDAETGTSKPFLITPGPAPVCDNVAASATAGQPVRIELECAGGGSPFYFIISDPAHGQISALNTATGQLTYTPHAGYSGPDSFGYKASNAGGESNPASVTLNIAPGPPANNPANPGANTNTTTPPPAKRKCKKGKKLKRGKCVRKKRRRK